MDISAWLHDLGLERYAEAFRDHAIDAEVLPDLAETDLEKLGVLLGHRKKLLRAIAALRASAAAASGSASPRHPKIPAQAERRQLTVLFCDLVGSTELSVELDPEDLQDAMRRYQDACAGVVTRYEGYVAKYLGDGIRAYFGWPQAHEDDAERAVRAGLELAQTVGKLEVETIPLAVRIGIATGPVVVGDLIGEGASQEEAVVGETPNLAARLQALASPGTVVIASSTRRLIGGLFEVSDLGPQRLKGFAELLNAWQVGGVSRTEGRFEALRGRHLTPLVGREHELAILLERWSWAKEGDGQVVLLAGEPGIGKSRLVRALRERLVGELYAPIRHFCSPYHTNSALHPVIVLLERAAGFAPEDSAKRRLDRLEALLRRSTDQLDEAVPLVAALLSIPTGRRYPPLELSPQRQKQRTIEVLVDQLEGLATRRPVLAVYEDVHWIDPTTLELLDVVVERVRRLPALVLITFRPEFNPAWTGRAHVTLLPLNRLGRRQGAAIVERLTGGKLLPPDVLDQIIAKTDGVPLFVEELTKTVLESGLLVEDCNNQLSLSGPVTQLAIPETLQDSLMERLDRLAPVKEIAQIGACIGREFEHRLLAAVAKRPVSEVEEALRCLLRAGLVLRVGGAAEAAYAFKHALVQDAAYQTLLRSRRRLLHAQTLAALEELFPSTVEREPELLAHHATQAGQIEQAVRYWHLAGMKAIKASANAESIAHLRKGLDLLKTLPEKPVRRHLEFQLRLTLGPALIATKGQTDLEVGQSYKRALELSQAEGDDPDRFRALFGLWQFHLLRAELGRARALSERCMSLARDRGEPDLIMASCRALGAALHYLGRFVESRAILEEGLELGIRHPLRSHPYAFLADPRVNSRSYLCRTLWMLGFPDQAARLGDEALALAEDANHPFTLANNLGLIAGLHVNLRNVPRTSALAERLIGVSRDQGFNYWQANGLLWRGWARVSAGEAELGFADLHESVAHFRAGGNAITVSHGLVILADACYQVGRAEHGLEALAQIPPSEERRHAAEIARLEGELLGLLGRLEQAAGCFEHAVAIAREQAARSLELRAAISYARFWRDRGSSQRGRELLAPVLGWFTEGWGCPDLTDAKALLAEMS